MAFYKLAALAALSSMVDAKMSEAPYFYNTERPLVVAHRGALGHFPEESLASFVDAYYGGTDFLEMDLQVTSDGYLIIQHDPDLNETTNILEYANRFADRERDDGKYYVSDFSLTEIRLLKRLARNDDRSPVLNDKFEVLTLEEIIEWIIMLNKDYPRELQNKSPYPVGLYIELKDYANNLNYLGINMAEKMDSILAHYGLSTVSDCTDKMPIIVQSFETDALDKYATLSDLPLVMLYNYSSGGEPDWELFGQKYHGIGPASDWVMNPTSYETGPVKWDKSTAANTYSNFIAQMHVLELAVHPYTLKDDSLTYRSSGFAETQLFFDNGVDGVFTEFPHTTYELFLGFGSKAAWPAQAPSLQPTSTEGLFLQE